MNPMQVAQNRTARLVREHNTPVWSTSTQADVEAAASEREYQIDWSEGFTGPDFCHVCGRCTDHFAEHSEEQLLAFFSGKGRMFRR